MTRHDHQIGLLHEQLLGPRLKLFALVRFVVAAAVVAGAAVARWALGYRDLPLTGLAGLSVVIACYNVPLYFIARRFAADPSPPHSETDGRARLAGAAILLDFAAITALVGLTGGAASPFFAFYLFHAIVASLLLSPQAAVAYCCFALVLYTGVIAGQLAGWLTLPVPASLLFTPGAWRPALAVWFCVAMLLGATAWLTIGIARRLRRGEQRLRVLNDRLDQLSRQRLEILDVTFHDLKAPVSAVIAHLTNLESGLLGEVNDRQRETLARCRERMEGQLEFLRDLLALAHLETTHLGPHMRTIAAATLAEHVAAEARELIETRGHQLTVDVDPDLPLIRCVPRLCHQGLMNYVTNAIKYTPPGGSIRLRVQGEDGDVCFAVCDNGIGIPADQQAALFDTFATVDSEGMRALRARGTGLGLSVVRRVVEAHGGRYGVDSREGEGSTFWFTVPAVADSPDEAAQPPTGDLPAP